MSSGLFGIGVSGLAAAQYGLLTTEHNIVNASTPGYTRQRTVQSSVVGLSAGYGTVGQGTNIDTVERLYNKYLSAQVNTSQTNLSEIQAYQSGISQIDNLLADSSGGLSPALQNFFSSVQQAASNPSLLSARQAMVSSAETMVSRFQSIDLRLDELGTEVNSRIESAVASINTQAEQLAQINQRIVIAESAYNQPANDLRDQRDQLISEMNKLIKVSTTANSDGSVSVFVGSGQSLVVGNQPTQLVAQPSSQDAAKTVVGIKLISGTTTELPESLIIGGELGGLVKFRNETLTRSVNELGRLAASFALTFNAQHALGQDMVGDANGDTGFNADFFSTANLQPIVSPDSDNRKTDLTVIPPVIQAVVSAAFAAPSFGGSDGNFFTNLTTSDYRLTKGATNFTLTRLSDNKQWSNADIAVLSTTVSTEEGFSFSLSSGTIADGDSFLIQPTANAAAGIAVSATVAADPRKIAIAVPFRTEASSTNKGSGAMSAGTMVGSTATSFSTSALPVSMNYDAATNQLAFTWPGAAPAVTVNGASATPPLTYSAGMEISFSGMMFTMTGNPVNGDIFTLKANDAAVSDSRNALALGKLQTQNTVAGSKASYQTAYIELVANVGIKTRELNAVGEAQDAMLTQSQSRKDSISGVNLDEEATNMLRYQQAYQASAKALDIASKLFDEILALG